VPPLAGTSGECVRISEAGKNRPGLKVPLANKDAGMLQRTDGLAEVTLSEGHTPETGQGLRKREWVVGALRNPQGLLGM